MKFIVEGIDIDVVDPTGVGNANVAPERHVVHATENASTGRLGHSNAIGVKFPK
jgi:hypothetical protein